MTLSRRQDGLTESEGEVMDYLVVATQLFRELPGGHPSELPEFVFHMHALQRIISARAMRRLYPEGWR